MSQKENDDVCQKRPDVASKLDIYLPGAPDHHNHQEFIENGTLHDDVESCKSLEFIEERTSHDDVGSCLQKEIPDRPFHSWSEPKFESKTSIRSIGTHSSYACGVHRPRLRGSLHCVLSVLVLPPAFVIVLLMTVLQLEPAHWILLDIFLAGKFMCFFASFIYHMFPFSRQSFERIALKADLIMISVLIGVTPAPFILQLAEGLVSLAVHATFVALTAAVVSSGQYEGDRMLGRGACVRVVLLVIQFVLAELQILLHLGYESPFWWASLILCILGFSCFFLKKSKYSMAWHSPLWCGWHEDFHSIIFVADVLIFIAAVQFLSDPTQDQAPDWML
mmetsp:Transcript_113118/g.205711  ORF Transcript_113118/g.205711 Transcript_113118/m.205711 type:complete len:334 (+) Transcript_113118:196-1197(+)